MAQVSLPSNSGSCAADLRGRAAFSLLLYIKGRIANQISYPGHLHGSAAVCSDPLRSSVDGDLAFEPGRCGAGHCVLCTPVWMDKFRRAAPARFADVASRHHFLPGNRLVVGESLSSPDLHSHGGGTAPALAALAHGNQLFLERFFLPVPVDFGQIRSSVSHSKLADSFQICFNPIGTGSCNSCCEYAENELQSESLPK